MIDLRDHFGIWERCGNTRFWKETYLSRGETFVDPLNGLLISANPYPGYMNEPVHAYRVVVKNGKLVDADGVEKTLEAEYPWVKRALKDFFTTMAYGWVAQTLREHVQGPEAKDHDLQWFLKLYKEQGDKYKTEGRGFEEPGREELLMAVQKALGGLEGATTVNKVILKDELEEFLGDWGLLECK